MVSNHDQNVPVNRHFSVSNEKIIYNNSVNDNNNNNNDTGTILNSTSHRSSNHRNNSISSRRLCDVVQHYRTSQSASKKQAKYRDSNCNTIAIARNGANNNCAIGHGKSTNAIEIYIRKEINDYNLKNGMKDVPSWLKSHRLHKYTNLIQQMNYDEMLKLTEEKLERLGVTKGARRKIMQCVDRLNERVLFMKQFALCVDEGTVDLRCAIKQLHYTLKTPIREHISNRSWTGNSFAFSISRSRGQIDDEDLPCHILRLIERVHNAFVNPDSFYSLPVEDEYYYQFDEILDRVISHEAFTDTQKYRIENMKYEWTYLIRMRTTVKAATAAAAINFMKSKNLFNSRGYPMTPQTAAAAYYLSTSPFASILSPQTLLALEEALNFNNLFWQFNENYLSLNGQTLPSQNLARNLHVRRNQRPRQPSRHRSLITDNFKLEKGPHRANSNNNNRKRSMQCVNSQTFNSSVSSNHCASVHQTSQMQPQEQQFYDYYDAVSVKPNSPLKPLTQQHSQHFISLPQSGNRNAPSDIGMGLSTASPVIQSPSMRSSQQLQLQSDFSSSDLGPWENGYQYSTANMSLSGNMENASIRRPSIEPIPVSHNCGMTPQSFSSYTPKDFTFSTINALSTQRNNGLQYTSSDNDFYGDIIDPVFHDPIDYWPIVDGRKGSFANAPSAFSTFNLVDTPAETLQPNVDATAKKLFTFDSQPNPSNQDYASISRDSGAGTPPGLQVYNFYGDQCELLGDLNGICRDVAALTFLHR